MGKLTLKYRLAGFVYLLTTFFFLPFSLIYLNQDSIQTLDLEYEQRDSSEVTSRYRMMVSMNKRTQSGEWTKYERDVDGWEAEPSLIFPASIKNNTLFVGKQ